MKGPHNETAPFFSGEVIAVSRNLAKTIVGPDWVPNVLRATYGTCSDDANLGKMVLRATERHNMTVNVVTSPDTQKCVLDRAFDMSELLRRCRELDLEEEGERHEWVNCGGHTSKSCAECTQGANGDDASWCNGDCKWLEKGKTCTKLHYM